jgi:hypothetical protein
LPATRTGSQTGPVAGPGRSAAGHSQSTDPRKCYFPLSRLAEIASHTRLGRRGDTVCCFASRSPAYRSRGSIGWAPVQEDTKEGARDVACKRKWPEPNAVSFRPSSTHKPTDHSTHTAQPTQSTEEPASKGLCDRHLTKPPSGAAQSDRKRAKIYKSVS